MLVALGPLFSLVLAAAPRIPNLRVPSATPPTRAFLAAPPPADEGRFSPGWLVAGIAGAAVSGAMIGSAIGTSWCASRPGEPGKGAGVAAFYLGLGTTLGYFASTGRHGARTAVVVLDVIGPIVGGLALLTAPLACAH
jgi:hypothetical protein